MKVSDIMVSPVVTINQKASLREATALLSTRRVSGLPVLDDNGDLVGIITEHDVIRAMLPTYEDIVESNSLVLSGALMQSRIYKVRDNPVSDIMTRNVITLDEDASILTAASTVIMKKVKRIPIMRGKKPVGIVSRIDILEAVVRGEV